MRLDAVRLTPGGAAGRLLVLDAPLSFYGGVDPETGVIVQAGHPRRGERITGRILALPRSSGSTVGSWTLLRMASLRTAPAAIVSRSADAVLVTGTLAGGIVHLDGLVIDPAQDGLEAVIPEGVDWLELLPGTDDAKRPDADRIMAGGSAAPIGSVAADDPAVPGGPVVVKLGGSLVTVKSSPVPRVDFDRLNRLSGLLAAHLKGPAVILHGAGSFGHGPVARAGVLGRPLDADTRLAWGRIQALQYQLCALVCEALAEAGLPVFPFQASALGRLSGGRFTPDTLEPVRRALALGLVPVLYGTPAFDDTPSGLGIASGDDLAPALALKLGFPRVVHLTDVPGVLTADPREDPRATVIPLIRGSGGAAHLHQAGPATPHDVTGAMGGKVARLREAATCGITSWIVDGHDPAAVAAALSGRPAGTMIHD